MQMIKGGDGVSISCSIIENTIRKPNLNLGGGCHIKDNIA